MKKILLPILLIFLPIVSSCKVEVNSSVSSGAVTWTASQNGSYSSYANFMGKETKVEISTVDYELTVNGKAYGKVDEGDKIKVDDDKVYRNGKEISPVSKMD